ncbi:IclR family transcriptional regulator [Modestobacter versicolor]|uniref:IclR family transcriptional regulator n=1 Tax=Modestobacter versicolor TaxID=429133 RepID=A0A323VC22_9ACTN|nr:IclR family transcriptional regulator [Modestobacter versicolor]MBB3674837.1 DNA-binding IclR family transcriptional regulator [Modestobacter versicolor]PZA21593.1 IclR family transcriptional regulator [Modestobacter versicolor]
MARTPTGESVLARAVRVLDAFTADEPTLTVGEVARRSGLHVATASRIVGELVAHGLLERTPDRRVRVGVRLWELGARASPTLTLRDAAMPFLEDVHAVVGHHVQLGVLDGTDVLFLERLTARDAVVNFSRIAGRLPLPTSSSGLVLLAHAPHELQEQVLAAPLRPITPAGFRSPAVLRAALAEVRRGHAAVLDGHQHEDATGVAVPVRDGGGRVVASLSVIVPNDGRGPALVPLLLASALGISRALRRPTADPARPG